MKLGDIRGKEKITSVPNVQEPGKETLKASKNLVSIISISYVEIYCYYSLHFFIYDSNTDTSKLKKPILALVSRASIGISAL